MDEYESSGGWFWEIPLILQGEGFADGTPEFSTHLVTESGLELGFSYTYDIGQQLCLTVGDGVLRVWAQPAIWYSTTGPDGDPPGNWESSPEQWYFVNLTLRHWDWDGAAFGQPTHAKDEFADPTWPTTSVWSREYYSLSGFEVGGGIALAMDTYDEDGNITYHVWIAPGGGPLAYFGIGKAGAVAADAYAFFL
jgi:hypothetical protein